MKRDVSSQPRDPGGENGGQWVKGGGGGGSDIRWTDAEISPHKFGSPPPGDRALANCVTWMADRNITTASLIAQTTTLLDNASPRALTYGQDWYAAAGQVAQNLADEYGISRTQAAAVLAATSPRNKWRYSDDPKYHISGNVADAYFIIDAVANPITLKKVTKTDAARAKRMFKVDVAHLIGTTPVTSSLTAREQAALDPRISGLPESITKATVIARGEGSPEEILGGNKVRSFFNNINVPDVSQSATVDTHQVRAMIGRIDLPDDVYEEIASNPARYQFFADAVRQVAADRGMLPHQVQAIVWEQWRLDHPDSVREAANPSNIATSASVTLGKVVYDGPIAKTPKRKKGRAA